MFHPKHCEGRHQITLPISSILNLGSLASARPSVFPDNPFWHFQSIFIPPLEGLGQTNVHLTYDLMELLAVVLRIDCRGAMVEAESA